VATPRQQGDQGMALQVDPLKANIPGLTRACALPITHTHTHTLSLSLSLSLSIVQNFSILSFFAKEREKYEENMYC